MLDTMAESRMFVPKNIGILGENIEGISAYILKEFGSGEYRPKNGLNAVNSQICTAAINSLNDNNGRNYFFNRVGSKKPKPNTLNFVALGGNFKDINVLEHYVVVGDGRVGSWEGSKFRGEIVYDSVIEDLDKFLKQRWRFFEVLKVK